MGERKATVLQHSPSDTRLCAPKHLVIACCKFMRARRAKTNSLLVGLRGRSPWTLSNGQAKLFESTSKRVVEKLVRGHDSLLGQCMCTGKGN